MLTFRWQSRGFSLIELMIGLAILGLLLFLGVPTFTAMLQNQKLRGQAESVLNGLQAARIEAIKRNAQSEFVLTDDDAVSGMVNALTPAATGANWVVRAINPTTGLYDFIDGKAGVSGSASLQSSVVQNGGSVTTVTFGGFGTTTLTSPATFQFTNPAGGACQPTGAMRCLNVVVTPGGQIKMCDPAVTATGDTRKC